MSDVTRSSTAVGGTAVSRVARARRSLPSGWWGMLLLVATEATLFGALITSYFYLRSQAVQWPPAGIEDPSVAPALALTALLLATTAPVIAASRAARRGAGGAACLLITIAVLLQAVYLVAQMVLFLDDLNAFSPRDTSYGSAYFTLLGVHHAHVAAGILLELGVLARLLGGLTNYRMIGVRTLAVYWSFVNVAAIPVVLTQLSPALW